MKPETAVGIIVVIAMILSLGLFTLGNIQDTQTVNSTEYNATGTAITSFSAFNDLLPVIVLIIVVVMIIWAISLIRKR